VVPTGMGPLVRWSYVRQITVCGDDPIESTPLSDHGQYCSYATGVDAHTSAGLSLCSPSGDTWRSPQKVASVAKEKGWCSVGSGRRYLPETSVQVASISCKSGSIQHCLPDSNPATELTKVVDSARRQLPGCRMSAWQAGWCTPDVVEIFIRGRRDNIRQAGEKLARALRWREEHKEVLSGFRIPRWQGDMRVLTRGEAGNPLIYMCMRNQVRHPNVNDTVEHMASVLEAAVEDMRDNATTFDFIIDCHGFRMSSNLNPRPMAALAEMLKNVYRERLGTGLIVDAPLNFRMMWPSKLLSEKYSKKIRFVSRAEALECILRTAGSQAAETVERVMTQNRTDTGEECIRQPSENADITCRTTCSCDRSLSVSLGNGSMRLGSASLASWCVGLDEGEPAACPRPALRTQCRTPTKWVSPMANMFPSKMPRLLSSLIHAFS